MLVKTATKPSKYIIAFSMLLLCACATAGIPENNISYLAENAERDGVIVTDSGLQYEVIKAASGPKPNEESEVTLHYAATLTDGTEIDNTRSRRDPASFPLAGTIPGLVEGVQLMSVGSMYRFVLPADLAYEQRGNGKEIRPGSTLIYDVELLSTQ